MIYIQHTEGLIYEVTCDFNAPASEKAIKLFEDQTGWTLPQDYREFLLLHNGANLLYTPSYGDGIELFQLKKLLKNINQMRNSVFLIMNFTVLEDVEMVIF
ncbi:SMI1/KNR4 family protein [[Brevibacterium] frigoritolerans]|uniref:SMI1/KNR4 family protein n=1 Tax=Peribacillus frigoritolerans TaxID=450367 RepID=A0A941FNV1_9BACI|nr:SMI1/KNR4 family protein [Peribacillus frigoritolerans]